jgi:hypothetical protein
VADPSTPPEPRPATGVRRRPITAHRPPPPRPELSSTLAPPLHTAGPDRPAAAVVSAVLWFAACAAGGFALLATMMDGDALRTRLTAAATEADPSASADLVRNGVRTTILLVLGVEALLVVGTLAGAALLLGGRAWSRWLLLAAGLLTVVAGVVAQSVVDGGVDLDRIGFLAQVGLVAAAAVTLLLRPTRVWLRAART